jgi:hypothetical protein
MYEVPRNYSQSLAIPSWVGDGPVGAAVVVGVASLVVDEIGGGDVVEEEAAEDFDTVALAIGSGPSHKAGRTTCSPDVSATIYFFALLSTHDHRSRRVHPSLFLVPVLPMPAHEGTMRKLIGQHLTWPAGSQETCPRAPLLEQTWCARAIPAYHTLAHMKENPLVCRWHVLGKLGVPYNSFCQSLPPQPCPSSRYTECAVTRIVSCGSGLGLQWVSSGSDLERLTSIYGYLLKVEAV